MLQTYILFSLVPEEAIFWIRSWPSSVLSSPRVLVKSSLFFDHKLPALILLVDCDIVSGDGPLDLWSEMISSSFKGWEVRVWPGEDEVVRACHFPDANQRRLNRNPAFRQTENSIGIGIVTHHFGEDLTCGGCLLGRRIGG